MNLGGSSNESQFLNQPHPAEIWDPATGSFSIVDQPFAGDIFCGGHTFLADGRLLVAGGTYAYEIKQFNRYPLPPFSGLDQSYIFDPFAVTWARAPDLARGRWYPTLVMLADGRILAVAGFTKHFPWVIERNIEIFEASLGWSTFEGAEHWFPLYPRLCLLPNGSVFYAGSYNTHYTFPFSIRAFPTSILDVERREWRVVGTLRKSEREEGINVLLPLRPPHYDARVLLAGGGDPGGIDAIPDAEVIDPLAAKPQWREIQPMSHARYFAYPVILPNRQVIVIGGRGGEKMHMDGMAPPMSPPPHDPLAVMEPEIFDPETNTWARAAPMSIDRLYHSGALLLPDGRVLTAGSNPATGVYDRRIEIYHPTYLFQGPRPVIDDAPTVIEYATMFDIRFTHTRQIDEVALIRPSVTTHCVNTDQRYIGLAIIERSADRVRVEIPRSRGVAPPGYYMLFVLSDGVPSVARFVLLR
jgi:hypothetical protein